MSVFGNIKSWWHCWTQRRCTKSESVLCNFYV